METLERKIASLEAEIDGYVRERHASNNETKKGKLLDLITVRSLILKSLLDQQAGELSFNFLHDFFYLIPSNCIFVRFIL